MKRIILIAFTIITVKVIAQPPGPNSTPAKGSTQPKPVVVPTKAELEPVDTSINKKDAKGLKQGIWKEKIANVVTEGMYINDKKEGAWKIYYPDGMLSNLDEYRSDKRNGLSIDVKNNGYIRKQCTYKDDVIEGRYRLYTNNGKAELDEYYKNGKLNGPKKIYYQNTKLQEESNYIDDKREGVTKWYFESGKISIEYNYKDGVLQGIQKTYYKEDDPKKEAALNTETMYKDNNMEGDYKEYFEDGKTVKITGTYSKDKKNSTWKEFDKDGKLIKTERYKDDVLMK